MNKLNKISKKNVNYKLSKTKHHKILQKNNK